MCIGAYLLMALWRYCERRTIENTEPSAHTLYLFAISSDFCQLSASRDLKQCTTAATAKLVEHQHPISQKLLSSDYFWALHIFEFYWHSGQSYHRSWIQTKSCKKPPFSHFKSLASNTWVFFQYSDNVGQCWSMLVNVGQCWTMLVNVGQCWSMLGSMLVNVGVNVGQCWSMLPIFNGELEPTESVKA